MRNLRPAFLQSESVNQHRHRILTFSSLTQVVSATVLIDTLILVFAGMTIWALGGYLKLALLPLALLTLAVAVPTMWACVSVAVLAYDAETNPENHSKSSPSWEQFPPEDDGMTAPGSWRVGPDGHAPSRYGKRIG